MTPARPTLFPKYTGKGTSGGAGAFGTKGQVMGYYDGNTVAAMWNYAQHFAMSDNAYRRHLRAVDAGNAQYLVRPDQRHDDRGHDQAAVHRRRRLLLHQ